MAQNDEGHDGALPGHKSLGEGGHQLSYIPQALLRGGDLQATRAVTPQKEPQQVPPAASVSRFCTDGGNPLPPAPSLSGQEGPGGLLKSPRCTPGHREKTHSLLTERPALARENELFLSWELFQAWSGGYMGRSP